MIHNNTYTDAIDSPSPNRSGRIIPRFVMMHYTASWDVKSVLNTFGNPKSKVSAHVTVDYNGDVYQHVPFNVKAWHAGPSRHMGYSGLNSYSVGIEIVNPGFLRKTTNGYSDAFGRKFSASEVPPLVESPNSRVGSGTFYWPMYTEAQLAVVEDITKDLISEYPIIDVVSHEEVDTRGWKTDPGPAFPMNRYKKLVGSRDGDRDDFIVLPMVLNVRSGPGTNFDVTSKVTRGTVVELFDKNGDWVRISSSGWVHGAYLQKA